MAFHDSCYTLVCLPTMFQHGFLLFIRVNDGWIISFSLKNMSWMRLNANGYHCKDFTNATMPELMQCILFMSYDTFIDFPVGYWSNMKNEQIIYSLRKIEKARNANCDIAQNTENGNNCELWMTNETSNWSRFMDSNKKQKTKKNS